MTRARVAVIGAGYFAPAHVAAWHACGAQVIAIADRDATRARALATAWGVSTAMDDAHELLQRTTADVVDLVVPPESQGLLVRAAIERGLTTICQKPFGRDLVEATELAQLADRCGVALVVHENFRFSPWYRECRRLIESGLLGRLYGAAVRLRPGDGQGESAYLERQPAFRTMPRLLVRETAIHFIDVFRYLLGEVRAVTARLRRLNPVIAGEDAGVVIFEFDDDRMAVFDGNRLAEHPAGDLRRTMGEMWLEGERGVLRLDGEARLWFKPFGGDERERAYARSTAGPFGGAVASLHAHVLAHLRDPSQPLENAARDYLANLRVQDAIYESHHKGARVALDADAS